MTPDEAVSDIDKWERLDDTSMLYAFFEMRAEGETFTIENAPKWVLLSRYMRLLRGDWSGGRNSEYLAKIYALIPEAEKESLVPVGWLKAVKNNADAFDGYYTDGRVMRDGQLSLAPEVADALGLPTTAASGNIAKAIGARALTKGGFRGSYEELFERILTPPQMVEYLTKIEGLEED